MNTRMDLVFWGKEGGSFQEAAEGISSRMGQLELLLSKYDERAELYQVNQVAFDTPCTLSDELFSIISLCRDFHELTLGYFDISLGKVYHDRKKENLGLTQEGNAFSDRVLLDAARQSLRLAYPDTELDLGGIGKGIALKEIDPILTSFGVEHAFISFGGSSILARGRHPHGEYWPFALEDGTSDPGWKLNNDFISVSKSRLASGKGSHILNPKSGSKVSAERCVVVKSKDPVLAEVLSTTLVAAPAREHALIAGKFPQAEHWVS